MNTVNYNDAEQLFGAVGTSLKKHTAEIADIVNVYGAKNLFEINKDTFYIEGGGGTYAFNNDGTISASIDGAGTSPYYILNLSLPLKAGEYIYSSGIEEVGANEYDSALTLNNTVIARGYNGTPNQNFTLNNDATLRWFFRIKNSIGARSFTIKPMIRLKSIADNTFTPYSMTNQQLTGLYDNDFANGAVNLLPNASVTEVKNGVTYTRNADGSITANGTANAETWYEVTGLLKISKDMSLKMSGCPVNGSNSTYSIQFTDRGLNNTSDEAIYKDSGNGVEFSISANHYYRVHIRVRNGVTMSNLVFKPMFTLASQPNSDYAHYVPYAKSNKELTDDISSLAARIKAIEDVNHLTWG